MLRTFAIFLCAAWADISAVLRKRWQHAKKAADPFQAGYYGASPYNMRPWQSPRLTGFDPPRPSVDWRENERFVPTTVRRRG